MTHDVIEQRHCKLKTGLNIHITVQRTHSNDPPCSVCIR